MSVDALELAVGLLGGVIVVVGQAVAARRLLGLRAGAARTIVAGAIGWTAFGLVGRRLHGGTERWLFLPMLLGLSVLATMGLLIVGEAVLPSGGRPLRKLRRRFGRVRRYSEIAAIAARHGLLGRERLARSLRMALEDGGVTFVKLGQMLSTRSDLLPAESVEELSRLQERVGPIPWSEVEAVLEAELGSIEATFPSLHREPLAAASVAQVHAGRLRSGEEVVVKVQRPGIAPVVERDLEVVLRLAEAIEARRGRGSSVLGTIDSLDRAGLNMVDLARGLADAIREELDFRIEARNIAAVAAASRQRGGDASVRVPRVHEELSGRRVLVMERFHGVPIRTAGAAITVHGLDRHALAVALLHEVLDQIVTDGVFHADPHPGNVLLLEDGRLGLLDFGSVGRIDSLVRRALIDLLMAVERRDAALLRDSLLELAQRPDDIDEQRLTRELGRFSALHLGPGTPLSVATFADLFRVVAGSGLTVPPEAAAAFRALATLDGTLTQLDPRFELVAEARAFAVARLTSGFPQAMHEELSSLLPALTRLPRRIDRIAGAVEQGRLSVNIRLLADERDRRVITTLVHQALLAFVAAAVGVIGVLLLSARGGPDVTASVTLHQLLGYDLLLVSFLLVVRVLFVVFRPERPR